MASSQNKADDTCEGLAPRTVTTILFDLDGTLYPNSSGFPEHVKQNVIDYFVTDLGFSDREVARDTWKQWFSIYHQSIRGIRANGYKVDEDVFWRKIRQGASTFLKEDPDLKELLSSFAAASKDMWIFTNCREPEAIEVLEVLGIREFFPDTKVIGASFLGEQSKPQVDAIHRVLTHIGTDPRATVFFEDSIANLEAGSVFGMRSVYVNDGSHIIKQQTLNGFAPDVTVPHVSTAVLLDAAPWLWSQ